MAPSTPSTANQQPGCTLATDQELTSHATTSPQTSADTASARLSPVTLSASHELAFRLRYSPGTPAVRRLSDGDQQRPFPAELSAKPTALPIRSRDGSRWAPLAPEQSYIRMTKGSRTDQSHSGSCSRALEPHTCNSARCAAIHVFETTELLELILSFLNTKDILSLRSVSRSWKTTVETSPCLRLHLFVNPQWKRHTSTFKMLPLTMPGIDIRLGDAIPHGRWIEVEMTREAARGIAQNRAPATRARSRSIYEGLRGGLGPRNPKKQWTSTSDARRKGSHIASIALPTLELDGLHVTQPPLISMQAFRDRENVTVFAEHAVEDEDELPAPTACAKLSCEAGITLGFLAETAQSLIRDDPFDGMSLDPFGSTDSERSIVYKAIVSFCDQPTMTRQRRSSRTVISIN